MDATSRGPPGGNQPVAQVNLALPGWSHVAALTGVTWTKAEISKVFAGPMSESVPSSITGFAHARSRADSTASFTYMPESEESSDWAEEEAIIDQDEEPVDPDAPRDNSLSSPISFEVGSLPDIPRDRLKTLCYGVMPQQGLT